MELQLVHEEDMSPIVGEEERSVTGIGNSEEVPSMQEVLVSARELAIEVLQVDGFSIFTTKNPKYGRQMQHFVRGDIVIVANYRGENNFPIMEIVPKNEAKIILQDLITRVEERERTS